VRACVFAQVCFILALAAAFTSDFTRCCRLAIAKKHKKPFYVKSGVRA
jgi:hypothetical protein